MLRPSIIVIALLLTCFGQVSADGFATKRLQSIAQCLQATHADTTKLNIRTNGYGEVEHIGLRLFPDELRRMNAFSPVYDFLERNLLERQLTGLDGEIRHRLQSEHVTFVKGNARTVNTFDGTEEFSEERIDLKKYRVCWTRGGREVLKISFDMDIELLSGCNSIELEEFFLRRLNRFSGEAGLPEVDFFPQEGAEFTAEGNSFLIPEMRNDLYYERGAKGWQLVCKAATPSKTLANLMLSPEMPFKPMLKLTLDKYGYSTDKTEVPFWRLLAMTIAEGCSPYFGVKERRDDGTYTGTLMLVNRRAGYVHMLSVVVPPAVLRGERGQEALISGRLYTYIPMHNVSDRYFETKKTK